MQHDWFSEIGLAIFVPVVGATTLPSMTSSLIETFLNTLRGWESALGQIPQRLSAVIRSLGTVVPRIHRICQIIRQRVAAGSIAVARTLFSLLAGLTDSLWSRRSEWVLQQAPGQGPAIACVGACMFASVITLVPAAGDLWSKQTYPVIAAVDRLLAPHGVLIGPENESPEVPVSRPMIAVVFGRIMPDDTVEEPQYVADQDDGDELNDSRDAERLFRPVSWQRPQRSVRQFSESYEIWH